MRGGIREETQGNAPLPPAPICVAALADRKCIMVMCSIQQKKQVPDVINEDGVFYFLGNKFFFLVYNAFPWNSCFFL